MAVHRLQTAATPLVTGTRGELDRTYETPHFVLHYGIRSPFTPLPPGARRAVSRCSLHGIRSFEYVRQLGAMFEYALREYHDRLGYREPLGCGNRERARVYVYSLPEGAESLVGVAGAGTFGAWIGVTNRCEREWGLPNSDRLQAIVAHCLFLAIAFAYRVPSGEGDAWAWWYEATATSMEAVVFPGNRENLEFVPWCFDDCGLPLDVSDGAREYEGFLFCKRLSDVLGVEAVRRTWEGTERFDSALEAIDCEVTRSAGVPIASAQGPDFFASNYCVANAFPDDAEHGYVGGPQYADAGQHAFIRCRISRFPVSIRDQLDHLACDYYYFVPPKGKRHLRLDLAAARHAHVDHCPLKGIAVTVTETEGGPEVLEISEIILAPSAECDTFSASVEISLGQKARPTGVLLLVANCSWGRSELDGAEYHCLAK